MPLAKPRLSLFALALHLEESHLTCLTMSEPAILSDRAVIRLAGEDRRAFLQGLITQDIDILSPDRAIFAALLTPQGKILFDFFIVENGDDFLIDCNATGAAALAKRLTLYKLRAKIVIEIDQNLVVAASENKIDSAEAITFRDPRLEALGWRAITNGKISSSGMNYEQRRISLGVPEFGKDFISDDIFLLDVNYDALDTVSYKKGCFVGQEVTSRMKRKGGVRKRILIAEFEGPQPETGAAVTAGESTLGEILSGVNGRALALIRLDRWEKAKANGVASVCEGRALQLLVPDYLKQD